MGYPLIRKIEPFYLPAELVIIITKVYDYASGIKGLCNLRLVCRCFNIPKLRSLVLGSRVVEVYLDDNGMDELETLAAWPEVAYHVQKIRVGIRKVSHYPLVIQKKAMLSKGPVMPGMVANEVREIIGFAQHLKTSMTCPGFRWSSIAQSMGLGDFEIRENDNQQALGCQLLPPNQDFRPSDALLQRFHGLLSSFPIITFLQSNEETQHSIVIFRDMRGVERDRFTIKDRDGVLPRSHKAARCVCKKLSDTDGHKWRPCRNVSTMSSFFQFQLASISRLFGVPAAMCGNLRTLDLNLKNGQTHGGDYVGVYHYIAQFISELYNLEHLRLGSRSHDAGTDAGHGVWLVLSVCPKYYGIPTAKLRSLKVACVDPAIDISSYFLSQVAERLEYFEVERPRTKFTESGSKRYRMEFLETLKSMPNLSFHMPGYEYSPGKFLPEEIVKVDIAPTVLQLAIDDLSKEP